jgi:NitT/TauT family transport system substrate-binding protein
MRQKWRSRIAGCACALLLAVAVPRPAPADDSLSIIFGGAPGLFDALDLVAQGAGFFNDEHLNLTTEHTTSASTCAQLVATGKADVCSMSVEPVLTGYEKGLRLQFFLARAARYSYVLGVLPDSPIRTLEDFKGKVIGEQNIGSAAEVPANSMLAGAGLAKSDYSFVPVGIGAQALDAFVNKRVDALAFGSDIVTFEVAGRVTPRVFVHPILKDIANVGYAATPATIAAKADVLKRYSRAIVESALFIRENPAVSARFLLQGHGEKITPEALQNTTLELTLLKDYLPAADPSSKRIGYLPPRGLELYSSYLVQYGFAHQVVPGSAVATDAFIPFANDFDHQALIARARAMR